MVCTQVPGAVLRTGRGSAQPHHCFGQMGSFHKDKTAVPSERQVTLELYNRRIALEGFLEGRNSVYVCFFLIEVEVMCNLYVYVYYTVIKLEVQMRTQREIKISCISSVS